MTAVNTHSPSASTATSISPLVVGAWIATVMLFLASTGLIVSTAWNAPHDSVAAKWFSAGATLGLAVVFFVSGQLLRANVERGNKMSALVALLLVIITGSVCVTNAFSALNAVANVEANQERLREQERAKLRERARIAKQELDKLPFAPTGTTERRARILTLRATPKANNCVEINGPISNDACTAAATLEAELLQEIRELDRRRETLKGTITDAEDALARVPPPPQPDARQAAIKDVLAQMNIAVTPAQADRIWRLLLALLIECGPALLAMAIPSNTHRSSAREHPSEHLLEHPGEQSGKHLSEHSSVRAAANTSSGSGNKSVRTHSAAGLQTGNTLGNSTANASCSTPGQDTGNSTANSGRSNTPANALAPTVRTPRSNASGMADAAARLRLELESRGGEIAWGQRAVAQVLGVAPSTVNKLLATMQAEGLITYSSTSKVTAIKLIQPQTQEAIEQSDVTA